MTKDTTQLSKTQERFRLLKMSITMLCQCDTQTSLHSQCWEVFKASWNLILKFNNTSHHMRQTGNSFLSHSLKTLREIRKLSSQQLKSLTTFWAVFPFLWKHLFLIFKVVKSYLLKKKQKNPHGKSLKCIAKETKTTYHLLPQ